MFSALKEILSDFNLIFLKIPTPIYGLKTITNLLKQNKDRYSLCLNAYEI